MRYCAICNGSISEVMWNYTLEGIRESVKMASGYGKNWIIYELIEV